MTFGKKRPETAMLLIALSSLAILLNGCIIYDHDDDEGEIRVCNYDNHEYCVVLRDYHNDRVEDEFWVGEWYDYGDQCDTFHDIDEGRYYIEIYRECDSYPWDTSASFYIDDDEYEYFWIDEDGDIRRD